MLPSARMNQRLAALLLVVVMLAASLNCGSPRRTHYYSFDAMDYFALLHGEISLPGATGDVTRVATATEWRRLVKREQDGGLGALSAADRRALLSGAAKAYLLLVSEDHVEVQLAQNREAFASVYDTYSHDTSGYYTVLSARQVVSNGVDVSWGAFPHPTVMRVVETRTFVINPDSNQGTVEVWERQSSQWICRRSHDLSAIARGDLAHVGQVATPVDLGLVGSGRPNADGLIELASKNDGSIYRYWLDQRSLWPVRIDITLSGPPAPLGPPFSSSIFIKAVNGDRPIQRPGESCVSAGSSATPTSTIGVPQ